MPAVETSPVFGGLWRSVWDRGLKAIIKVRGQRNSNVQGRSAVLWDVFVSADIIVEGHE